MFTPETRIRDMVRQPEFAGYEYMVNGFPSMGGKLSDAMDIGTVCHILGAWNPQDVTEGMNYLLKRAGSGRVFYHIYNNEQRRADPSKNLTGIAALTLPKKSRFVAVCAGGGYASVCSMAEAYPVIRALNDMGYAAFAVQYRCGVNAKAPNPMEDLAQAIRFILSHSEQLNVERDHYAVMGFSAGGHLAACFGTESLGYARYGLPEPSTLMLCYPVITMGEQTNLSSRNFLLGQDCDPSIVHAYSIESQVTHKYPASFVWQFDHDDVVPVKNSQMIVEALETNHVPWEYETFPGTSHGVGLGTGTTAEGWLERAAEFWAGH